MKIFVALVDFVLLVWVIYLAITEFDPEDLAYSIPPILLAILIVLNIILIIHKSDKSWLDLYFKRKALEEKKKIDELSSK